MVFAHDTELNLRAAVALVNSRYSSPQDVDDLATTDALDEFFSEYQYPFAPRATSALLAEVSALREPLRTLFTASPDEAVDIVNSWLSGAGALPQLVRHHALDWHVHAVPVGSDPPVQIRVETAMAMIDVIREGETSRISACAQSDCAGIVLDLSRNRSKRFCSARCGNRDAVSAYRARSRSTG